MAVRKVLAAINFFLSMFVASLLKLFLKFYFAVSALLLNAAASRFSSSLMR